jgi:hypothetical protein
VILVASRSVHIASSIRTSLQKAFEQQASIQDPSTLADRNLVNVSLDGLRTAVNPAQSWATKGSNSDGLILT